MPVRPEAPSDLLSLYVQLARVHDAAMPAQAMRQQLGSGVDRLLEIGAAQPGRPLSVLKCPACYEDHSAEVTYDAPRRRSWFFCPEAGRIWVDDAALATLHLNTDWLPDQLARALDIASTTPRLTVIEKEAWLLGDTIVGSTKVSVALAVGIKSWSEVDRLIAGLGRRKLLDVGLLVVAGCELPGYVGAATGYGIVALDEVVSFENSAIKVEQARLGGWISGLLRGSSRPIKSRGGRPPKDTRVLSLFKVRRERGERYVSKLSEAKAIRSEWPSFYPDEAPPGASTIRKHLPAAR